MPIVTSVTTPPGEPGTQPPVELPGIGQAAATYYDPSGGVWPLTDPQRGWFTLADGVSGLGAAPVEFTTDPHPRGGARIRHVQPQPRDIVWPLHVWGETHMKFVERWRLLARAFTSTSRLGPGVLEVARPNGSRRRIAVHYRDGWEAENTRGDSVDGTAVLSLFCEDPYWYDPDPVTVHREHSVGEDFLVPYPSVSSGQVLGATTVSNPGDVVVWPTWRITGPASLVTFTRSDTGEAFSLDPNAVGHGALLAGEQVTVRTDPPQVRYQDGSPDGSNWVGALNWPGAVLWGLPPGDNQVTFQLDGSGFGSAVDLTFLPRYETA
jgi:hypothetical protein